MRSLLLAALLASPLSAGDDANLIVFKGGPASAAVPPGAKPGQTIWESGASEPAAAFTSIFFQGTLKDPGLAFEASVRSGASWGPWSTAEVDREPNGRFWGKFRLSAPAGARVKVRALHRGAAAGSAFEIYRFEAERITPEERPAPQSPPAAALSAGPSPEIVERPDWRAAPPSEAYVSMIPVKISVHHTAAAQPLTLEDAVQEMRVIQRFHQKGRGWIDIGYHFLIDGSGRIFRGRPETAVGAHVRDRNTGNLGISLMGNFHAPANGAPTAEQVASLTRLLKWLMPAYSVPAAEIRGHRDQGTTDCPGDNLYALLEQIRRDAASPAPGGAPENPLPPIEPSPLLEVLEAAERRAANPPTLP